MSPETGRYEASHQPGISVVATTGIAEFLARHGAAPERILAPVGLAEPVCGNPWNRIPLVTFCDLFEQSARVTGVDTFGLRFGVTRAVEILGTLGEVVLNAPTLGAALEALSRLFPAMQEQSLLRLSRSGPGVRIEYQINDGRIVHRRHDAELTIGVLVALIRRVLGAGWAPERVEFEHTPLVGKAEIETLVQAPVTFSAPVNAIAFPAEQLATPISGADVARALLLERHLGRLAAQARPDDLVGRVMHEIRLSFGCGEACLGTVARRMGMSETGLYRALRRRDVEFSDLVRGLRRELAAAWLKESDIRLTEIAFLLGYSELSAFSRAFRAWAGVSPVSFRRSWRLEAS